LQEALQSHYALIFKRLEKDDA